MSGLDLIVWDCDGTLVDSQAAIIHAMRDAFRVAEMDAPSDEAIRGIVGLSVPQAVQALAPGAGRETLMVLDGEFRRSSIAYRKDNPGQSAKFYDGARETLDRMNENGTLMGVATGKARRGLDHLLDTAELHGHFVVTQSADDAPSKPHPGMLQNCERLSGASRLAMIGDSSFDMLMARAHGCHAIGVTWGYHRPDILREAGADVIVEDFEALEAALAQWGLA